MISSTEKFYGLSEDCWYECICRGWLAYDALRVNSTALEHGLAIEFVDDYENYLFNLYNVASGEIVMSESTLSEIKDYLRRLDRKSA